MNVRLFLCIAMGVFVAHLGVVMFLSHLRPQERRPLPPQNFKVRSQVVVDRDTGEKTIYREITVSTRVLPPPSPAPEVKPVLTEPESL